MNDANSSSNAHLIAWHSPHPPSLLLPLSLPTQLTAAAAPGHVGIESAVLVLLNSSNSRNRCSWGVGMYVGYSYNLIIRNGLDFRGS